MDTQKIEVLVKTINCVAEDNFSIYISIKKDLRHTFKDHGIVNDLFQDIIIPRPINIRNAGNFFYSIIRQELDLLEYLNRFR